MVTVGRRRKDLCRRFYGVSTAGQSHYQMWNMQFHRERQISYIAEEIFIFTFTESLKPSVLVPEPKVHFVRPQFQQTWTAQRRRMQPREPCRPLIRGGSQKV